MACSRFAQLSLRQERSRFKNCASTANLAASLFGFASIIGSRALRQTSGVLQAQTQPASRKHTRGIAQLTSICLKKIAFGRMRRSNKSIRGQRFGGGARD